MVRSVAKKGRPLAGVAAQHGQGVGEEIVVGHAEVVDHLLARIVLLCVDFLVAVGAQKGVHVVVL